MIVKHNGNVEADIPVLALTDEAPKYNRPMAERQKAKGKRQKEENSTNNEQRTTNFTDNFKTLLASPNIGSKQWVYEQYDTMVRTNTAVLPGADAAVIRIKETRRAVAMCLDGNGRYCAVNPREGAKLIVAEAARNVVCVGAKPVAITNCLNFASPERPEVMWAFSETIDGMAEACEAFEAPVVSGNVSFYNETEGKGILPTPVIGMVGILEDARRIVTQGFKAEGDLIALLGATDDDDLSVSEYAASCWKISTDEMIESGSVPKLDLEIEKTIQQAVIALSERGLIKSAHDCADGGLSVAIAESCFSSLNRKAVGAQIEISDANLSVEKMLFVESPSRIVISFAPENLEKVKEIVGDRAFQIIGKVTGKNLKIKANGETAISATIAALENIWRCALENCLEN
jgi:phosphoribosylformylglycinamidine synthase